MHVAICVQFADLEDQFGPITIDKVPGIALQLVPDLLGEAGWAESRDRRLPPYIDSQQGIEADQMIDMHVRRAHRPNAQQVAGR